MSLTLAQILSTPIEWLPSKKSAYLFKTTIEGKKIYLRLNDFPIEPLCTLLYGDQIIDLEDMQAQWTLPRHRENMK